MRYYTGNSGIRAALVSLAALALVGMFDVVSAQTDCSGHANAFPPYTGAPVLESQVPNGKLYNVGPANNTVKVLHLYGTPYENGVAQGKLLGSSIKKMYSEFYEYIELEVQQYIKWLPKDLADVIAKFGVTAALELEALATGKYIPQHFIDELKGLADGLGIDYGSVLRVHMFPELIKASCSMYGAWGNATGGGLVQLRSLDWGLGNPFRQFPVVVVYHPKQGDGHPFAALTWNGFIGALTGYGTETGVSQKVWINSHTDPTSRFGIPWHFLMRDILQYDMTLEQAISRVESATRTCSIFLGIGARSDSQFRVIEYSHKDAPVFNASSPFPGYAPTPAEHPLMPDLVYVDKHAQPSTHPCMASLLKKEYGRISPETTIQLTALFQTGDLHIGVYDFAKNRMYIAVADQNIAYPAPTGVTVTPAHDRQFIQLDMSALLSEKE